MIKNALTEVINLSRQLLQLFEEPKAENDNKEDIIEERYELLYKLMEQRDVAIKTLFQNYAQDELALHSKQLKQIELLDKQLLETADIQKHMMIEQVRKQRKNKKAIKAYQNTK